MSCDELYHLLTIRDPTITSTLDYRLIKHVLIMRIVAIVIKKINEFEIEMQKSCKIIETERIPEIIEEIEKMLDTIYSSCLRNLSDDNNIGLINVFLFQFAIMFSKHMGIIHEFYETRLSGVFDILISNDNWMDYNYMKSYLSTSVLRRLVCIKTDVPYTVKNLSNPAYNVYGIFFIKWVDVFDSDRVIIDYLNKVFYCEIVSHATYADGRCISPFEYVFHDLAHGVNFLFACGEERVDLNLIETERFYLYLKHLLEVGGIDKSNFQKIKAYIFYELHEGECSLGSNVKSTVIENERYSRFFDLHDLKTLIPRTINTKKKIQEYFEDGVKLFKEYFHEWKTTQSDTLYPRPISYNTAYHLERGGKTRKKRTSFKIKG